MEVHNVNFPLKFIKSEFSALILHFRTKIFGQKFFSTIFDSPKFGGGGGVIV